MKLAALLFAILSIVFPAAPQEPNDGPTNEKAQKTFKNAQQSLRERQEVAALEDFKKADKQDGGRCLACQKMMIKYGTKYQDWKTATLAAEEMVANAQGNQAMALAHYQLASVIFAEALHRQKEELFGRAHEELTKAVNAYSNFPDAALLDGRALAYMHQDDAAKAQFEKYIALKPGDDVSTQRARRYVSQPDLARARLAPAFAFTALDGTHISMDQLQGKVVLLDFWATWCEPCREALPHIKNVARKFQGEPLVVISISLDTDQQKWKEFVEKNEMTWPQYFDGGFTGSIAKTFAVNAIPHTFTIDADGVLQEEHVGDASIEGKIKKLLARAREMQQSREKPGA